MSFRAALRFLLPSWLLEGEGGDVAAVLATLVDASTQRLETGLLARFPQQGPDGTPGPADALVALGRDRRVVRGISETDAAYAVRLTQWLVERRTAGNPFTLMRQLAAYCGAGFAFRTVDVRGNWYSRDVDGVETSSLNTGNWDWDGDTARWSRFWVVVYPSAIWAEEGAWDVGTWDDLSAVWGSTVTPEQATTLVSIVADWKPAGTRGDIILAFDDASFDPTAPEPDGTWGKHYRYSVGVAVESRLSTARYFGA